MFEQAFKNIDDALWKESGCTTELDYTEQTSWLLFLKYLDVKSRLFINSLYKKFGFFALPVFQSLDG